MVLLKAIFLLLNCVYFVLGVVLLVVGIVSKADLDELMELSTDMNYTTVSYVMIFSGVFIMLVGVLGLWGALQSNTAVLKVYMFVLVALFLLNFIGVIAGFVFRNKLDASLKKAFQHGIDDYYNSSSIAKAVDFLQENGECCGVLAYTDYFNFTNWNVSSNAAAKAKEEAAKAAAKAKAEAEKKAKEEAAKKANSTTPAPGNATTPAPPAPTNATVPPPAKNTTVPPPAKNTTVPPPTPQGKFRVPKSCCINQKDGKCRYNNLDGITDADIKESAKIYKVGCYQKALDEAKHNVVVVSVVAVVVVLFQIAVIAMAYKLHKSAANYDKV